MCFDMSVAYATVADWALTLTHPIFNQLVSQFGSTRGRHFKRQILEQFLVERASFMLASIDEMIEATSRTEQPETMKRGNVKQLLALRHVMMLTQLCLFF